MKPENFFVLDRFVEHMLLEDYSSTLFANSFSQACVSEHEANAICDFCPMQSRMFMCARLTLPDATSERASRPPQIGSNSDRSSPDPNSMLTASPKRCSLQGHHYCKPYLQL